MKSCKEYGYLIGLQGLISRIIAYVTILSKYQDPIINELEFECGLFHEDALILYTLALIDLNEASIMCSTMVEKQMFFGTVNYKLNNSKVELSCYPTASLKTKLMKIRNDNKIKEKMNYVLYKHENDYCAKVYLNFDHYVKLSKMYKRRGYNCC